MEQQNSTITHNTVLEHTNPNLNDMAPEAPKPMAIVVGAGSGSESVLRSEVRGSEMQPVKRGRGRPRKYNINGGLRSPTSAPPGFAASNREAFETPIAKRGRGRPRGSGKLQILASLGGNVAETAGGNFTPHVVTVNIGEDVVNKILAFFQKGPQSVCILSATGSVSSVVLRQPNVPGGLLKYEGRFEILSLGGSCAYTGCSGGGSRKEGVLSISLAKPDGRVFGGAIDSALIAAGPIQLVMATFKQNISKQMKRRLSPESSGAAPPNQDSEGGRDKVPKLLLEGEQSYPAPPTTPPPPPAVAIVPKATIAIATPTNGEKVQDGVVTIASTTTNNDIVVNDNDDNVIIPTAIPTKVVPHVVITEDLNLDSASVDDDGVEMMDQKTDSSSAPIVDTNSVP